MRWAMPRPPVMVVVLKPVPTKSPPTSLIHSGLSLVLAMSRACRRLPVP